MLKLINIDTACFDSKPCSYLTRRLKQKLEGEFRVGWKNGLFCEERNYNFGNKLRSYRNYNNIHVFKEDKYLNQCRNGQHLKYFAKLRQSSHRLIIEPGRHVPRKQRVAPECQSCKICNINDCEDEEQFLIGCQKYETQRKALFREMTDLNVFFDSYSDAQKFVWLMSNEDVKIIRTVSAFVHQCFKI